MTTMEEPIRSRFDEFTRAWNAHDVPAMVACFAAAGNITHPLGAFAAGHQGITDLLTEEHEGAMRDSRWVVSSLRIQPLSDRTAVVQCEGLLESVRRPNGKPYELPHQIDAVVVQDGHDWQFVSFHPSFVRARG